MDVNTVTQAISSFGFPIVACIVMFKYLEKERESHKEEMQSITKALNDNTAILNELKNVIERLSRNDT